MKSLGSEFIARTRLRRAFLNLETLGAPDAMTTSMTTRLRYSACARPCARVRMCACVYARLLYGRNARSRSLVREKERESRRVNK